MTADTVGFIFVRQYGAYIFFNFGPTTGLFLCIGSNSHTHTPTHTHTHTNRSTIVRMQMCAHTLLNVDYLLLEDYIVFLFSQNKLSPSLGLELGSPDPEADEKPMCHHAFPCFNKFFYKYNPSLIL